MPPHATPTAIRSGHQTATDVQRHLPIGSPKSIRRCLARGLLTSVLLTVAAPAVAQVDLSVNQSDAAPAADEAEQTIELRSPDADIARRLTTLFPELDGLEQIKVEVRGGVVTLHGLALTAEDRQKAEAVASRVAGVVSVENEIEIEHRVDRRLDPMVEKANSILRQTIAFLPILLLSILVFVGLWLLGRLLTGSRGLVSKVAPNPLVQTLIGQIIRLAFILLGVILAMRIMGATALLGSVLGAAGVAGLALGFAIRDTIENYIASILLSIRRPFAPNDHVIIEGMEGHVTRLNSRATFLTSLDGSELRIPNAIVYKAKITNFSQIPQRRFEFTVGIGYENDLCHAMAMALDAVKASDGVLSDPEPFVLTDALDASTVRLKVFGWVDERKSDFGKVRGEAIRVVKSRFEDEKISMPAPIQNIRTLVESDSHDRHPSDSRNAEDVTDTSADHSVDKRVRALRSKAGEDLLTTEAPRE